MGVLPVLLEKVMGEVNQVSPENRFSIIHSRLRSLRALCEIIGFFLAARRFMTSLRFILK